MEAGGVPAPPGAHRAKVSSGTRVTFYCHVVYFDVIFPLCSEQNLFTEGRSPQEGTEEGDCLCDILYVLAD